MKSDPAMKKMTNDGEDDVNGEWIAFIYRTFIQSALQYCVTFTHSYTDGGANRARQQPTRQEQLGLGGVLLRDTSTLS